MRRQDAMNIARWLGAGAALGMALVLGGCGRAPLAPVHGKVSYKGLALQGGVIVFSPDTSRGERGAIAVGRIREDGGYTLYTGDAASRSARWPRPASAPIPGKASTSRKR
jgi:hypothetical protein